MTHDERVEQSHALFQSITLFFLAAGSSEFQAISHPFIVMRKIVLFIHPSFLFTNTKVALRALIDDGQDTMSQNDDGFLVSQLARIVQNRTPTHIFSGTFACSLAYIPDNKTNKSLAASSLEFLHIFPIVFQWMGAILLIIEKGNSDRGC